MTAKEKKDIILRLLSETTYNLHDDFSVSILQYKFDWEEVHVDEYRLTFYPNNANNLEGAQALSIGQQFNVRSAQY